MIEVMLRKYKHNSASFLWAISLAIFVAGTMVVSIVDYVGEKSFNVSWLRGPDLFPNMILGYPLLLVQLIAILLLIMAGVKIYDKYKGAKGLILGITIVIETSIVCFFAYIIGAYWYQFELMGRSM